MNGTQHYKLDHQHHKSDDGALDYGFVPKAIINSTKDKDWKVRLDGVEKVHSPFIKSKVHLNIIKHINL